MSLLANRMKLFQETNLYVVITERFCGGRQALEVLDAALDAGVRLVQCREKDKSDRDLYTHCRAFREHTLRAGALLIIDDRLDLALAVNADGVHLGQDDLPLAAARSLAPELIIGASTHHLEEALAAQTAGASYVNIGPVFATQTKEVPTGVVGPSMIDAITPHLHIPFTCMGGIKAHNIAEVIQHGARHAAVVTAVTEAEDIPKAVQELMRHFPE